MMGMVITQAVWEMVAMETPVEGSPPYAAGNTTVFRPKGVPKANMQSKIIRLSTPISFKSAMNRAGRTMSRRAEAM